jgi:Protein of unknown function (DUF4245)
MLHDGPVTEPADRPTVEGSGVQPTGRRNARMRQTVGDMVRSMAVVLGVVFLIVLLAWRPQNDPVKVVETAGVIARASAAAQFPVSVPDGLPDEWRATSARWEPTEESDGDPVLHLGYVTPSDAYAQVSESTARSARYLDEQTAGGRPTGAVEIGGTSWETWETPDRRSLVSADGNHVTIVSGTSSWAELQYLAGTLAATTS